MRYTIIGGINGVARALNGKLKILDKSIPPHILQCLEG